MVDYWLGLAIKHLHFISACSLQASEFAFANFLLVIMETVLLLSLAAAIPLFLFFLLKLTKKGKGKTPPGPPGIPFFGNIFQLESADLHTYFWKLSNTYGPIMSLRLGFRPAIVISSAKVAKEALKTNDYAFSSRPPLAGQQKLSYDGFDLAFAPYNNYWREMRKLCVIHLFNLKRVQSFSPIREDEVARMISKISKCADEKRPADLSDITLILTSSIICRVAFGKRYEDDGKETKRFHNLLDETQAMFGEFFFSDYFPYMGWVDMLTGSRSRLEKVFHSMDELYQEIIDEHLDPNKPKSDVEDFMDLLIGIKKDNLFSSELTWEQIKGVLMNVFVAGTDTSASSLVWGMTMMIMYPRVMKKAQEELRTIMGNKGFIHEEDIPKLPYFKAVVKELMRMYPATPLLVPRETHEKTNVAGYDIDAKTQVFVNAWAIGRDPEAWEKPHEFYPERFMGKNTDFKGNDFELIPFGAGRRICPGIHMGTATVEIGLANLLYSFNWELPAGMKVEDIDMSAKPGIVMHKSVPLCLMAAKHVHAA